MKKIIPHLFNDNLGEAMEFYLSVFKDGKVITSKEVVGGPPGHQSKFLLAHFELAGQEFLAINGGPMFPFTEAVSFYVGCETQDEIDYYWDKLSAGGKTSQCGWLKDKFGLSWQVAPTLMFEMMDQSGNDEKIQRVMDALMKMTKIDLQTLKNAAA
jgi:predicted 3-demethylubiquinone-9 3-methyltransferase (glyoxalase superfamily)